MVGPPIVPQKTFPDGRPPRGRFYIGTSGYQYEGWRGRFYPEHLPRRLWFSHYCRYFQSIEINNTFYGLPGIDTFDRWRDEAPHGFCYALKFSRYGSHLKRLKDPAVPIGTFLERAERLGKLLGPILVQLPPNWPVNVDRLAAFLEAAPRRHRWAIEFRDASWLCEPVYRVLEAHGAALVIHDLLERHPWRVTTDWVYLRFHGEHYERSYAREELTAAAHRITGWLEAGLDTYAYFNNTAAGAAPANALELSRCLEAACS